MEQKNFNHLLLIKDPAVFIESCYLNLLDRNVSPGDILEIERLFLNGMPKEGLIYCIARSKAVSYTHLDVYKRQASLLQKNLVLILSLPTSINNLDSFDSITQT